MLTELFSRVCATAANCIMHGTMDEELLQAVKDLVGDTPEQDGDLPLGDDPQSLLQDVAAVFR